MSQVIIFLSLAVLSPKQPWWRLNYVYNLYFKTNNVSVSPYNVGSLTMEYLKFVVVTCDQPWYCDSVFKRGPSLY